MTLMIQKFKERNLTLFPTQTGRDGVSIRRVPFHKENEVVPITERRPPV